MIDDVMPWRCFVIEEADPRVEYLTMHTVDGDERSWHRQVVYVAEGMEWDDRPDDPPDGWPATCLECGVELGWRDYSKMGTHSWRDPRTGETRPNQEDWGPGALFDATEWASDDWRGPDGKCWGVVMPPAGRGDFWLIDSEASSGGRWTRSGEIPDLVVTPSILTPNYHGFLGSNGTPAGHLSDPI